MSCRLTALSIDAGDPARLARFWADLLDRPIGDDRAERVELPAGAGYGFGIRFRSNDQPRRRPDPMHLDLTSKTEADQQRTVAEALALGARHLDVGQRPEEGHIVLADPEGNAFCVIEAGNRFLEGCGFIGAIACDGSRQVGQFWSEALGWPLVWDQDEETAIQSPRGGTKISWGGPPFVPTEGLNRLRFDLEVVKDVKDADGDATTAGRRAEIERLALLGATVLEVDADPDAPAVLADPDGNTFWLTT